jgi:parallel beta-helix repeat protein
MHRNEKLTSVPFTTRWTLAVLLVCLPTLSAPAGALNDLCGATIVADLKLDHDLTCTGDGLIVGADGIELDLNGHAITGSGSGAGVRVTGHSNVTISGGTVRNFFAGVLTNTSTNIVVKGNEFRENVDGVDLQAGSHGNTIKENIFLDNTSRGIMVRSDSTDHVIKENTFTGDNVSVLLFGSKDSTVKENILSASRLAGIRINFLATGNLIIENTVISNPVGILFNPGTTGNAVIENSIELNTCGLRGPSAGNTFKENLFSGNGADACL